MAEKETKAAPKGNETTPTETQRKVREMDFGAYVKAFNDASYGEKRDNTGYLAPGKTTPSRAWLSEQRRQGVAPEEAARAWADEHMKKS